jgi:putative ABC transport system permease protein
MWPATLRNVLAHKRRLVLTALAVVIGVAFVAGTMVLTDTLRRTFDELFGQVDRHTSVAVRSTTAFTAPTSTGVDGAPVPAGLLDTVRAVPGVREAVGDVSGYAQLVRPDGTPVTTSGAPTLGVNWTDSELFAPAHLEHGRGPQRWGEVAVDSATAKRHAIHVGDTVTVLVQGPPRRARVVGTFRFGTTGNLAGATLTAFDPRTAQRLLLKPGHYTVLKIAAAGGVGERELARRVQAVLPAGFQAVTGTTVRKENASAITEGLRFFGSFLLVFAVIALFVGSFIIWNTFSMLVAQRTRELALLRAIGASRGQVTRSVLGEACAVGVIGAAGGLGAGLLLASGLRRFLRAVGMELPAGPLVLAADTVAWSFAVGLAVTLVAALFPARRAGRVPPVAALNDDVALPAPSLHRRAAVGALVGTAGGALLGLGLTGAVGQPLVVLGAGAGLVFVGVTALSPVLSRPVLRLLGAPLPRLFGIAGKLGNQNALRNPRRTSATAAALMIGLAFVSLVSVLASSFTASAYRVLDESLDADYVVATKPYLPFSPQVATDLAQVRGWARLRQCAAGRRASVTRARCSPHSPRAPPRPCSTSWCSPARRPRSPAASCSSRRRPRRSGAGASAPRCPRPSPRRGRQRCWLAGPTPTTSSPGATSCPPRRTTRTSPTAATRWSWCNRRRGRTA